MRTEGVLLALLVGSSLALVRTSYQARHLYTEVARAEAQAQQLAVDHQRLEAERQHQATPPRVERLARERLGMHQASAAITAYVVDPGAAHP